MGEMRDRIWLLAQQEITFLPSKSLRMVDWGSAAREVAVAAEAGWRIPQEVAAVCCGQEEVFVLDKEGTLHASVPGDSSAGF